MTKLSEIHAEYERIMQTDMDKHKKSKKLAQLMTRMEHEFGIPALHNPEWEAQHKPVIALYRIISESRSTLWDK